MAEGAGILILERDAAAVPPGRIGGFIGRFDYVDRVAALLRGPGDSSVFP